MYLANINITVLGDVQLDETLTGIETRVDDWTPPLERTMDIVDGELAHQFEVEGDDPKWPALSKPYARRKLRLVGQKPILVFSGKMKRSLTERTAEGAIASVTKVEMRRGSSVTVGEGKRYNLSALHQKPKEGSGRPARPMFRLRDGAQTAIVSEFSGYLYGRGEAAAHYNTSLPGAQG